MATELDFSRAAIDHFAIGKEKEQQEEREKLPEWIPKKELEEAIVGLMADVSAYGVRPGIEGTALIDGWIAQEMLALRERQEEGEKKRPATLALSKLLNGVPDAQRMEIAEALFESGRAAVMHAERDLTIGSWLQTFPF